uniref:Glycosyltransferase n=1 Tax=Cannabis sativa TaxID=3483 RepID=A0A803PE21_CANSA
MDSVIETKKAHAVCVPFPAQGHVNPMMQLAKLLHSRGFHITYVNTEFNHRRLIRSKGLDSVKGLSDFHFETIPDGLPPSDRDATQDIPSLCDSTRINCLGPFKKLLHKLNNCCEVPPVTCIVTDGVMTFGIEAAREFGIPGVVLWTASACSFMGYLHYDELVKKGLVPFKGSQAKNCLTSSTIIFNTFQELEQEVLDSISVMFPNIYTIGPLCMLHRHLPVESQVKSMSTSLWKEDSTCINWLDKREPNSVVYVNYGSITTMTEDNLKEFAWGLANSNHSFVWIVRPDVVMGSNSAKVLSEEFFEEIKDRGLLVNWCSQKKVLEHSSVGVFLTHCGWNSTIETICAGVPVICWPFFADQQTNCHFACKTLGIGVEISPDVKREEVSKLVKEMMEGEKGKKMKEKSLYWKKKAYETTDIKGDSYNNFDKLIRESLHYI